MKKIFFISLLLTFVLAASAQQSSNAYRRLADSLFDNHNYQTAATYYEKAIKNADQAGDIMLSIAECHTRMNHIGEAGEWFTKARENHATFNTNDVYEYVIVLMAQQKNNEAERELETLLSNDPNALHAKRLLDDLQHADKYYLDSAKLSVTALPFNTPVSEFAPAFYKDGIVFASSKTEGNSKRKYHWDNSDFLSLYYSIKSADGQFQNPVAFKKDLDSRYHDGPAAFYGGYEKMIMNRNKAYQVKEKKDTYIWYLSLYDGQYSSSADSWQLTSMPFDEPPYSIAHPSISEDGNILYFVSDRPGGYGGSDIYRVTKVNGVWSKPFNLGPMINSPGHDVFPFVIGNTLYFASNGHGGLGGLDIFKSTLNQNGFTPAINLGYPINSTADDFALITKDDGETGYFSSSRNGNDDLFAFDKRPDVVKMLAYIFDGVTKGPLPAASIQLITSTNEDKELSSDNDGYIHFELSRESAYVLIGSKDGKTGMVTGFAIAEEDQQHIIHQIPLFGDTSRIACIGTIENEVGQTQKAASITIVDKTTGEKINHDPGQSLISFMGEKGHSYSIEIQNEQGDVSTHELVIDPSATEAKTWKMVLTESSQAIGMAARIFNAENDQPLGGATVKIITFSEPDQELVADEKGIVDFTLQEGTAYVVVGSRENLTGMHSGIAEAGQEKLSVIHPVPAHGDPSSPLPVVALIADLQGKVLDEVTVTVTEKASGKSIPVKMKDGIVSFLGERGKEYDITATANGFQTASENVVISRDAAAVNKISMIMEKEVLPTPATFMMAARVFKAEDNSPLAGAKVTITSFVENEQELIAGNDGLVQFKSPEGSAYIIMASRDDYYGMYSGIADKGTEKSFMTHPVPTTKQSEKHVTVVAQVADANETSLKASDVVVKEKSSGKVVPVQLANGMVNFQGEKGKDYSITVDDKLHGLLSEEVNIPTDADQSAPIAVSLLGNSTRRSGNVASNNSSPANQVPVAGHIKNQEGVILDDVVVTVTDKGTGDKITNQFKNGLLNFSGEKGKIYIVSIQDKNQKSQLEEIEIPENADGIEKFDITLGQHQPMIYEVGAHLVDPETNQPMGGAIVTVVTADGDMELTADDNGLVTFRLPEGTDYIIIANKDNYSGMQSGIVEKGMGNSPLIQTVNVNKLNENQIAVEARFNKGEDAQLKGSRITVTDKFTGRVIPVQSVNGVLSFVGEKGKDYTITVEYQGLRELKELMIPTSSSQLYKTTLPPTEATTHSSDMILMAAHVFKADDKTALSNANVQVISFSESDKELIADKDGIADFMLPEGTAFIVLGTKDKFTGMYTGVAEKTSNSGAKTTHPVPAYALKDNEVAVAGRIANENGQAISSGSVTVINKTSGEEMNASLENGILSFVGEQQNTYAIHVVTDDQKILTSELIINESSPVVQTLDVTLHPVGTELPITSSLIILNGDGSSPKFYISSNNMLAEIIERDGSLYLNRGDGMILLGDGTLESFIKNPTLYRGRFNLVFDDIITLQNIYFDYNKATLDSLDKSELDKAKIFLSRYPSLKLFVSTHADDRGSDRYNLNLSKRRAKSIESYLVKKGINADRIQVQAMGESAPAIPCFADCDEAQHQKNRRAEFSLNSTYTRPILYADKGKSKVSASPKVAGSASDDLLEKYGDRKMEGLSFKVSIGAYRFNHTLTFENLKDIGIVEKEHIDGITYYYLSSFQTLRSAEEARQLIVNRGVRDAFVSAFNEGHKISFKTFLKLVE